MNTMRACGGSGGVSPTEFGTSCLLSVVIVSRLYLVLKNPSFHSSSRRKYKYMHISSFPFLLNVFPVILNFMTLIYSAKRTNYESLM